MTMRVLVCGDYMIDEYWYGDITRIAPEAPVPVFRHVSMERRAGGAANVAENLRAMGVEIRTLYSPSASSNPVVKVRMVAQGRYVGRADFDGQQLAATAQNVIDAAETCDLIVLSDYGKGTLDNVREIIARCNAAGIPVFVDPKSRKFKDYAGATLLKPNLAELQLLVGGWRNNVEMSEKVRAMQRDANIKNVLATCGKDGMVLFEHHGAARVIEGVQAQAIDVCGAGDTALAAFAASVARGTGYYVAAMCANKAAGIAVTRFGTTVVKADEIF